MRGKSVCWASRMSDIVDSSDRASAFYLLREKGSGQLNLKLILYFYIFLSLQM